MAQIAYSNQASKKEELHAVFDANRDILGKQELSKSLQKTTGRDIALVFSYENVVAAYETCLDLLGHNGRPTDIQFFKDGLETYLSGALKNEASLALKAFYVQRIRDVFDFYDIKMPGWVPMVFKQDGSTGRRFDYFFDFSTVDPDTVRDADTDTLILVIRRLSTEKKKPQEVMPTAMSDNEALLSLKGKLGNKPTKSDTTNNVRSMPSVKKSASAKPTPQVVVSSPVTATAESGDDDYKSGLRSRVQNDISLAENYMQLYSRAKEMAIPFDLTLNSAEDLTTAENCHFTGIELTTEKGDDGVEPDNFAVIELLDDTVGFKLGNIVVCSKAAQDIKKAIPADSFPEAIKAIGTLLKTGADINMLKAMYVK